MRQREKLRSITILYGIAATLVVLGHSHPLHADYPHGIITWIYRFHMPLFFSIAGVLTAYTSPGRSIFAWWKKKAARLLIPYVILTLAACGPKVLLSAYMTNDMTISLGNLVRILLIPREGIWGHFWFIPVYLILMLVSAACWKYLENAPRIVRGGYCSSRSY